MVPWELVLEVDKAARDNVHEPFYLKGSLHFSSMVTIIQFSVGKRISLNISKFHIQNVYPKY